MTAQTSMFQNQTYQKARLALLPIRERPAYRVQNDVQACNLVELLAAVIGGQSQIELAEALIKRFGGPRGLVNATTFELNQIHGVGTTTAVRIKASLALAKRLLEPEESRPSIHSPADIFELVSPLLSHREQEFFVVVVLNTRNNVLDVVEVIHGGLNSAQVRIAEVFRPAIRMNAAAIVCAHNHPSGDPTASPDDVAVTRALVKAGKNLDVEVLDHVIVGHGKQYVSLKKRHLGFS